MSDASSHSPLELDARLVGALPGEFFTRIANGMEEGLIVLDEAQVIRAYNRAAEAIFGYPAIFITGRPFRVLERPMTLENGDPLPWTRFPGLASLKSGRESDPIYVHLLGNDSTTQRLKISAFPCSIAPDGHPTHVALLLMNTTPVRALEDHLARLDRVINQAADAILIMDERGVITDANPAFTRLTGYDATEVVAGSLRIMRYRAGENEAFEQVLRAMDKGEVWSNRIEHRTKIGGSVDCLATLSPLWIKGGKLAGFVYMMRDMARIAELERRMVRSQKMEAIGTLAGGIAHDFNNIIHSISGYAELAHSAESDPRVKGYLDNVLGACDRAGSLVRQILTFSRREEKTRMPVLLQSELEKAVKFIRVTLPASTAIEVDIQCKDGAVFGDATELHQVIINLMTNAYQALPRGEGKISLRAKLIELSESTRLRQSNLVFGPYVEIRVSDTGKGIPPEIIERIFEPFFTTKPVNEGTGMGLSIVHGIVTAMNGDISVESTPGQGTSFTVILPLTANTNPTAEPAKVENREGKESLLIVDDEPAITAMISEMLRTLGYRVVVESDVEVALEMVRADRVRFDLILTDQTMPKLTGIRFAEKVREIRGDIPILLCTGNGEADIAEQAKAVGISRILYKPLRLSVLASLVRTTLDEVNDAGSSESAP